MGVRTGEIPRVDWQWFLHGLTSQHAGDEITIEIVDEELGDQQEVRRLPLAYVEYDPDDDVVVVGVGGRDGRYPVVLRDIIQGPRQILADTIGPEEMALDITGADRSETIVVLHPAPAPTEVQR